MLGAFLIRVVTYYFSKYQIAYQRQLLINETYLWMDYL
ncbi:hypothetical protein F0Z19_1424 [Vibrio cyclitrophicus]|nr:hypothetical protein F0Z19_1424 [Vibrio cyclitrophicus]